MNSQGRDTWGLERKGGKDIRTGNKKEREGREHYPT